MLICPFRPSIGTYIMRRMGQTLVRFPLSSEFCVAASGRLTFICLLCLCVGYALKPLNHTKHNTHRYEAYCKEYGPANPDRCCVVDKWTNPEQEVTDSRSTEPQALAETEHMLRRNLRHERKTEWRDEELCNGKEEVEYEEHPRT